MLHIERLSLPIHHQLEAHAVHVHDLHLGIELQVLAQDQQLKDR